MKKHTLSKAQLRCALLDQPLCNHRDEIVDWLIMHQAQSETIRKGCYLIKEGDSRCKDVFLIVSGTLSIELGGHFLFDRQKNIHVGEMAMIMNEPRTASVKAVVDSIVIRIPQSVMEEALDLFPIMWKPIAKTLCDRLHQRRTFFRSTNKIPRIFIGSSGASLGVAEKIANELRARLGKNATVNNWPEPTIFTPSTITVEKLIAESKEADFGIFILAGDDIQSKRGTVTGLVKNLRVTPRDNVIFEAGMFTASCGLNRTFFVCEKHPRLQIPSDLAGVTHLPFKRIVGTNMIDFGDTIDRIVAVINEVGVIRTVREPRK